MVWRLVQDFEGGGAYSRTCDTEENKGSFGRLSRGPIRSVSDDKLNEIEGMNCRKETPFQTGWEPWETRAAYLC